MNCMTRCLTSIRLLAVMGVAMGLVTAGAFVPASAQTSNVKEAEVRPVVGVAVHPGIAPEFADGGLGGHVPTGPGCATPHIRFLFIVPRFHLGLPPHPASRRRTCPLANLRLCEYLVSGLSPDWIHAMHGTHV